MRSVSLLLGLSLGVLACGDDGGGDIDASPPAIDGPIISDGPAVPDAPTQYPDAMSPTPDATPAVPDATPPVPDAMIAVDAAVALPDATPVDPCTNGVLDPGETDIDCGGVCLSACADVFDTDGSTLAIFELNGDALDSSGNARDATLLGGTFMPSSWGQGLAMTVDPQGLDWSPYAALLVHPYTVEMVLTPTAVDCYHKLLSFDDTNDDGWYYCDGFEAYPNPALTDPTMLAGTRHYFAFVSTDADHVDVYFQGTLLGNTQASFVAPPLELILFRDDSSTTRSERLDGVVDAVRLSSVARSAAEITATTARLATQP